MYKITLTDLATNYVVSETYDDLNVAERMMRALRADHFPSIDRYEIVMTEVGGDE